MNKWDIKVGMIVKAETQEEAWRISCEIVNKRLNGAHVFSIRQDPVVNPDAWIAINEKERMGKDILPRM